jgi:hypothetical protein
MTLQVRYGYLCRSCGNVGETFFADASHDGEAMTCATCGGPVTLARDYDLPGAFDSKRQPGPAVDFHAGSIQSRGPEDKLDSGFLLPWFDFILDASFWWESAGVEPQQAARLLWHINPLDNPEGTPAGSEDNRAYRAMLHEFTAVQKAEPGPRRLPQWLDIAQKKRLRYHSWIDTWLLARTASHQAAGAVHWTIHTRQIADELDLKDEQTGAWSSLHDMAGRVAEIAAERKIKGPQGPLTGGNILREALQGGKWKRLRKAKTGKSGTPRE